MDVLGGLGAGSIGIIILLLLFFVAVIKIIGSNEKKKGKQYKKDSSGKAALDKVIKTNLIDFALLLVISAVLIAVLIYKTSGGYKEIWSYLILWPLTYFVYQIVMLFLCKGRTIGNRITKTRLMRSKDVECTCMDVLVRSIIMTMPILIITLFDNILVLTLALAIIYWLVPFFTKEKYAIHDIVSNTYYFEDVKQKDAVTEKVDEVVSVKEDIVEKEADVSHQISLVLDAVSGDLAGMSFEIDREIRIGRDYSSNIILPPDAPEVSRHHCKLNYDKSDMTFFLTDLNSSFGTFLGDGRQIPKGGTVQLKHGDDFYIGVDQRFRIRQN